MPVIVGGGDNTFTALAFGTPHPRTMAVLESQFTNLGNQISAAGEEFMARQRAMFEQFNGSEALRLAKAALRAVSHAFTPNIVQPLLTIGALQQAQTAMQPWIMANPVVRELFHQQRLDGYSDTYVDMEPGLIGERHTDYRHVMHGMLQELPDTEDGEGNWKITFNDDDRAGQPELTFTERIDILTTWDAVEALLGPGKEDPTSVYANLM